MRIRKPLVQVTKFQNCSRNIRDVVPIKNDHSPDLPARRFLTQPLPPRTPRLSLTCRGRGAFRARRVSSGPASDTPRSHPVNHDGADRRGAEEISATPRTIGRSHALRGRHPRVKDLNTSGRTSELSTSGVHPFREFGIGLVGQFYPPAGDQHKPCSLLDVGLLGHLKTFGGITTEGVGICRHQAILWRFHLNQRRRHPSPAAEHPLCVQESPTRRLLENSGGNLRFAFLRVTQHVAAAPNGLDVVPAIRRAG